MTDEAKSSMLKARKASLRKEMRRLRNALGTSERRRLDASICTALSVLSDVGEVASPIAVYLATPAEIDLAPFIETLLCNGDVVVAPRWNGSVFELARLRGLDGRHLRTGPMGILEPVDADVISPADVAAWIVPGLAFTRGGNRLGYGGGWYDRFLREAHPASPRIGVAYPFQLLDEIPSESHDVTMTMVVVADEFPQDCKFFKIPS